MSAYRRAMGRKNGSSAIELAVREITSRIIESADIHDLWESYPEIGEYDWETICDLIKERADEQKPGEVAWFSAYAELKRRSEVWEAQNGGAA